MNRIKFLPIFYRKFSANKQFFQKFKETTITPIPFEQSEVIKKLPIRCRIDEETINLLERLSLVDCSAKEGKETLEAAIDFADSILPVNVTGIQPLTTVLEDIPLRTREDKITDGNCKHAVLENAPVTEDGYFVTPPGQF